MIGAAALLVLTGLGLFVAGVITEVTTLFWICVGTCLVAGVLLLLARRRMARPVTGSAGPPKRDGTATPVPGTTPGAGSATAVLPAVGSPGAPTSTDGHAPDPATRTGVGAAAAGSAEARDGEAGAPPSGRHAPVTGPTGAHPRGEPPVEEVEVTDLLLVVDLHDEVLVVDEHPRYHVSGCRWLAGRTAIPLPIDEARTDGFTPCGSCKPDQHLADVERGRRAGRKA